MAAAMARHLLGESVHLESAGTSASEGASATRDAVQVMKERGLDLNSHRSRSTDGLNLRDFDLLIAMTPAIAREVRNLGADPSRVKTLDIEDPYCKGFDAYRAAAIAIERALRRLFDLAGRNLKGQ
jgi:protein-tyrosine phosphatase